MLATMAFAAEHPVLAQSEFRPVGEIERREKPFEVVSEFQPSGDQPKAIEELAERIEGGEKDVVRMYIGELVRCALTSCSADSRRSARACSCTARSVRRG